MGTGQPGICSKPFDKASDNEFIIMRCYYCCALARGGVKSNLLPPMIAGGNRSFLPARLANKVSSVLFTASRPYYARERSDLVIQFKCHGVETSHLRELVFRGCPLRAKTIFVPL